jgi:diketogulonate reductase-like aldo/keto reductase
MAYSPLGGANSTLLHDPVLGIGAAHGCSPAAGALAWTIRSGKVIAIPEFSKQDVHQKSSNPRNSDAHRLSSERAAFSN